MSAASRVAIYASFVEFQFVVTDYPRFTPPVNIDNHWFSRLAVAGPRCEENEERNGGGTDPKSGANPLMKYWHVIALCSLGLCGSARAGEPPHYTFVPQPPGTIVQSQLVYLAGEAMHSQWRAVLSKKLLGTGNGTSFYQWFLSFYAIDDTVYRLKYRSPNSTKPFARVTKAQGAPLWFPVQAAKIAGTGELMGPGAQQLVVQSHETGRRLRHGACGRVLLRLGNAIGYDDPFRRELVRPYGKRRA